jgi:Tol biopolymer transport system component
MIAPGTRLGPYEILSAIGAGGMGEVYRARDTKLNRDVALKILPVAFTSDPDRLARFTREAQTLAALNHPNIAHIHGLEESGGLRALVMELVEGEDLAQRLVRGPIPLDEALPIARQIAEALEAAHEQGIIHRDLKPANIKVRPDGAVKVLDFGLAKALDPTPSSPNVTNSPTITTPAMTQAGVILGTAAYMSPEQARGKAVDKRADIWAFGVVLYEMLTGQRLFEGETVSDTLIDVASKEPDWDRVPKTVQRMLRRCLEKDPRKRLRDIGDAWELLNDAPPVIVPSRSRLGFGALIAAAVFAVVAAGVSVIHFREKPPVAQPVRFQIPPPEKNTFTNGGARYGVSIGLALSPDGRQLAFSVHSEGGVDQLWVRALDNPQARPLPGTEGATQPFWSPDSRFIAFSVQGKLKKVEASGGPPQPVCDLPWGGTLYTGGAWSPDGVIIVRGLGVLIRCDAGGRVPWLATRDPSLEAGPVSFLPDGRHFVVLRRSTPPNGGNTGVYLGSLDAKLEPQSALRLVTMVNDSDPYASPDVFYVPAPDLGASMGYLVFVREGSIMAQGFDSRRLELAGEATPIVEPEAGVSSFSASTTGVLAYQAAARQKKFQGRWIDRDGKVADAAADVPSYVNSLNFSPDGARMAGVVIPNEIWLYDFARGNSTRLATEAFFPVWSPDGRQIIFLSRRDGVSNVIQKDSSGAGNEEVMFKSSERITWLYDWSRDGFLLYGVSAGENSPYKDSLWFLSLSDRKATLYLKRDALLHQARFSPDGHCVAYASNESGTQEVYVQPFPVASGSKWQVSKGGTQPRWRGDGKELFYGSNDSKMMAQEMTTTTGTCGPPSQAGIPKALFTTPDFGTIIRSHQYDVSADGKRFLIRDLSLYADAATSPITVVLNWAAGLKK